MDGADNRRENRRTHSELRKNLGPASEIIMGAPDSGYNCQNSFPPKKENISLPRSINTLPNERHHGRRVVAASGRGRWSRWFYWVDAEINLYGFGCSVNRFAAQPAVRPTGEAAGEIKNKIPNAHSVATSSPSSRPFSKQSVTLAETIVCDEHGSTRLRARTQIGASPCGPICVRHPVTEPTNVTNAFEAGGKLPPPQPSPTHAPTNPKPKWGQNVSLSIGRRERDSVVLAGWCCVREAISGLPCRALERLPRDDRGERSSSDRAGTCGTPLPSSSTSFRTQSARQTRWLMAMFLYGFHSSFCNFIFTCLLFLLISALIASCISHLLLFTMVHV